MARGWEEGRRGAAGGGRRPPAKGQPVSADEIRIRAERATLMLARTRALSDLQHACAPAHRAMLEQAIADLDRRLKALET